MFVVGECVFSVSDVINGGCFGNLGPLHLALGPNRWVFWYFGWPATVLGSKVM